MSVFLCSPVITKSNQICISEFPKTETYQLEHKKTTRIHEGLTDAIIGREHSKVGYNRKQKRGMVYWEKMIMTAGGNLNP